MKARIFLPLLLGATLGVRAEPSPADDPREVAKREAWTSTVLIISLLEQGDNSAFPGIRAWLEDFHQTAASTPPPESDKPFPPLDTDALVTRNPHFWMTFYEVQPGDPGLALLHAALLLSGGEAQRASVVSAFGLQRSGIPEDIRRGLSSIIAQCQSAQARSNSLVRVGMKLHDRRDFGAALAAYDQALAEWPCNGTAYAERGLTFRARAMSDARANATPEMPEDEATNDPPETTRAFAAARKHDPFNLLAYQGDDPAMLAGLMALVRSGLPVWEAIRKHPEQLVKHDHLRTLSEACRDAGIDDFALVLRQLVVAAGRHYTPDDQELISECLRRLAPAAFTGGVLARIGGEARMPKRQIVVPVVVEPPEVAQTAADAPKPKAEEPAKPKAKTATTAGTKKKGATSSAKAKSKDTAPAKSAASAKSSGTKAASKGKSKSKKKG